jgi:hypothetical protein
VHGPQVMMPVFDLTVYGASLVILVHLRKFCIGSAI